MQTVDLTGIQYFLPILSFLLVFVVSLAFLMKTKILGNAFIEYLVSFILAIIFVTFVGPQKFIQNIAPAVAVLIVCAFFILLLAGIFGKDLVFMNKGMGIIFVVILFIVFIGTAFVVFSSSITPYLPGGNYAGGNPDVSLFSDWLFSSRVGGAILLLIVSALVAWVLVKFK
ncbi:MAG: hypothetical protein AABW82_03865 [Nanoarchaeota archaeon]